MARTTSTSTSHSAKKQWMFRALAVTLPILALEASARIYWTQFVATEKSDSELYQEMIGEKVLGDEVPYQFFPNREFTVAETPTTTNNLALRGDEFVDVSKPYSGTRILCIGDSVTFGYSVSGNPAAYPAVLERALREAGVECQVLNAGMPRYRTGHLEIFFQDHLRHYKSDILIILGGWNNANDHVLVSTGTRTWPAFLQEHWFMLKVVRRWNVLPKLGTPQRLPASINPAGVTKYGNSLRRLINNARASGMQPAICTLPHFFANTDSAAAKQKAATFTPLGTLKQLAQVSEQMNSTIRDVANETDALLIDLSAINDHESFADAIHPNDAGSARIAQRVMEELVQAKLVTGR